MSADPANPSGWKYRRATVFVALAYCGAGVAWIAFKGGDTALNREIVSGLLALAGATIGAYVFGAAWERTKGLP